IFYVFIGGMKGTTWVQIIKATLLLIGVGVMSVWMLGLFGFNFSAILGEAANVAGTSAILDPGLQYGTNTLTKLDFISLGLALVLVSAGLVHLLMRFYMVSMVIEALEVHVWGMDVIWLCVLWHDVSGLRRSWIGWNRCHCCLSGRSDLRCSTVGL